jgi:hypothetical protein
MKEVPRSQLPWKDCIINDGVTLINQRQTVTGILVGDRVICIIPPWPKMTHETLKQLIKAFEGGVAVRVEVEVSYKFTGKYYNPADLKRTDND